MSGASPVAVVAGATGPIGRAITTALTLDGVRVAALSRSGDAVPAAVLSVACNLADADAVDTAVGVVESELGPVEILVNAAHPSQSPGDSVVDTSRAVLERQLGAVVDHAGLCARVVPGMRRLGRGRIVYVSGALMARPAPGAGAYGAAKAAASTLTRFLALEEGRAGITANVVAPGRVVDPTAEAPMTTAEQELAHRLAERLALPDFPTPADVARAVTLLVDSPALTAQTIWVTGGEPIAC